MKLYFLSLVFNFIIIMKSQRTIEKRALQKSHEKPPWVKWSESFLGKEQVDQQSYLVKLLRRISYDYLSECTPVILYDTFTELYDNQLLEKLLTDFPFPYVHGKITDNYKILVKAILNRKSQTTCVSYMLFMKDVMRSRDVIGEQNYNKVVVVARSSQWRVIEFLSHKESQNFVNLLVVVKSGQIVAPQEESPYILYTHRLYMDALGSSKPDLLTTWLKGRFTRNVNLFPKKMMYGFSGHRFIISVAHQPPFIITKGRNEEGDNQFEGIELRLIEILAKKFNFTTDYREVTDARTVGSGEAVTRTIEKRRTNIGLGGIYTTQDRMDRIGISQWHSQDCAVFITLTSTALPRYRAIMGPFQWTVWLALTAIYLLAIFPLTFSDKHTLKTLLSNPEEMENMFWYMFGTFTNCFSFSGRNSWSKSEKLTTRLLISFYWLFTIIITACYTGSIIAFVTLPMYPAVVDTVNQIIDGRYQIGTLDKEGWPHLFANITDKNIQRLLKNMDLVPDIESGLKNTTKSFFWKYAFLGSRAQLDYIVRTNFSTKSKRSVLHITEECFAPFSVGIAFPKNSIYSEILNDGVLLALQAGLINKLKADVEWGMMRTATGKLLAPISKTGGGIKSLSYEDRALTLDDTQGMFLLLGAGFLFGAASLISEWLGGCFKCCKGRKRSDSTTTIESNPRSHAGQASRDKFRSIQFIHLPKQPGNARCPNPNPADEVLQMRRVRLNKETVNCDVHGAIGEESKPDTDTDEDFNEEINKIFENIFGEENVDSDESHHEIDEIEIYSPQTRKEIVESSSSHK